MRWITIRQRVALAARMTLSLVVLFPVAVLLWGFFSVVFGLFPLFVLDEAGVIDVLLGINRSQFTITLPTVSELVGVSAPAGFSVGVFLLVGALVTAKAGALPVGRTLDGVPTPLTIVAGVAGLYIWGTETAELLPTSNPVVLLVVVVALPFGGYFTLWSWRYETRKTVEGIVETVTATGVPAGEAYPSVASTADRLAQQADIEKPTVYVTETDRAESFTLGSGGDAILVVSTGLLERLDEDEQTAVLAHEISHLLNNDIRLLMAAFTPLYILDREVTKEDEQPENPWPVLHQLSELYGSLLEYLFFRPLRLCARVGVSTLSVGREYTADRESAALTGQPTALATALAKLDDDRSKPETDLREWEETLAALDILAPETTGELTGSFGTHPPTAKRVDRLETLAAKLEQD